MTFLKSIINLFKSSSSSEETIEISKEVENQNRTIRLTELGVFSYTESGFEIDFKTQLHSVKWCDIERLSVYKADLMTTDEVYMDIVYDNKTIVITEETPGWYQFIDKLKVALPEIKVDWEAIVLKSPFEYNFTTIYERSDRKMPVKSNFYSVIKSRTKEEMNYFFQDKGWTIRKPSLKSYQYENSWSDLVLDDDDNGLLLHGLIAYHPNNITIIRQMLNELNCPYKFEIHNEEGQIVEEQKHGM